MRKSIHVTNIKTYFEVALYSQPRLTLNLAVAGGSEANDIRELYTGVFMTASRRSFLCYFKEKIINLASSEKSKLVEFILFQIILV